MNTRRQTDGPTHIDIHQPHAIGEWAEELGVSPTELIDAVKKVGPAVEDVTRELEKGRAPHPGLY
jgi:hypothetical protein